MRRKSVTKEDEIMEKVKKSDSSDFRNFHNYECISEIQ